MGTTSAIPDDIRRYLIQCVPSVPYIEAVLLMRDGADALWSAGLLGRRLYLVEEEAARLLDRLRADGIIASEAGSDGGYRYAPASPKLSNIWDQLAVVYARNLIEVSTLIHTKTSGKAQMLADAFVWRKEK